MSRINGFLGRRDLLKLVGVGGAGLAATASGSVLWGATERSVAQSTPQPVSPAAQPNPEALSPDQALKRLLDGNKRFCTAKA
jgi:carbonic anhydrase